MNEREERNHRDGLIDIADRASQGDVDAARELVESAAAVRDLLIAGRPVSTSFAVRPTQAADNYRSASDALGDLSPGCAKFMFTRGQWSILDALICVLEQTGPADATIWTWRIGDYDIDALAALREAGTVRGIKLIVDATVATEGTIGTAWNVAQVEHWFDVFGRDSVRFVRNHCKIVRVWNDDWRVLLRGSMNFNANRRIEQLDVSEGCAAFDLVRDLEETFPILELPLNQDEVDRVSGMELGLPFLRDGLRRFSGVKTWDDHRLSEART